MTRTSTTALIQAVEAASSAEGLLSATRTLAAHVDASAAPAAIGCLLQVLSFNNPGAAVAAVDGLIRMGPAAVEPLLTSLDPSNYGARAWAVRALAGIGDVRGLEVLEEALATDVGPSVRRAAARGIGALHLQTLDPHGRALAGERALSALEAGCGDGEWVVRYGVVVGLESLALALAGEGESLPRAQAALAALSEPTREDTPVVRLRARQALDRLAAHTEKEESP